MSSVPTNHALILAGALFVLGTVGVLARRNLIFVLMSLELMLSATGIAFVAAASRWQMTNGQAQPDGQVFFILILVTAAAEVAVGLTLLLRIYHNWKNIDSDEVSELRG